MAAPPNAYTSFWPRHPASFRRRAVASESSFAAPLRAESTHGNGAGEFDEAFLAGRASENGPVVGCAVSVVSALSTWPECVFAYRVLFLQVCPVTPSATPLGASPAPGGNYAALLFRFLPQQISRAEGARLRPWKARFLVGPSPKAPLALGSGAHFTPTREKRTRRGPRILRRFAKGCPE